MNIVVTGGSSGLGKAIVDAIYAMAMALDTHITIHDWSRDTSGVDVTDSDSIALAASKIQGPVYALINCAGINHIEWLPNLKEADWDAVVDTNAKAIFLTTKALLENLRGGTVINIVSNASHVPMTTSAAYNASKGAAAILSKQLARELIKTHDITVFAISPNKLAGTGMSKYIDERVCELRGWTPEEARAYQLAALPAREETDPAVLADFIAFLLSSKERHKYLAGCDIPYGL